MVISALSYCERYYSLNPLFKRAFEFAIENGANLEEGKHTIEENKLYIIIANNDLRREEEAPLEAHNEYIDIQIVLKGCESFGVKDRALCLNYCDGYNEENDIEFFNDKFDNKINLAEGDFVIFFPEDAHAPLIGNGKVKKIILKIHK